MDISLAEGLKVACAHLRCLHGAEPTETLDIAVSCDGTWCKRGHTATHGVVVVMSLETDDFEILTKRCGVCSRKRATGISDQDFEVWLELHKKKCEKNHLGSSPAMESKGAVKIWERSVKQIYQCC